MICLLNGIQWPKLTLIWVVTKTVPVWGTLSGCMGFERWWNERYFKIDLGWWLKNIIGPSDILLNKLSISSVYLKMFLAYYMSYFEKNASKIDIG